MDKWNYNLEEAPKGKYEEVVSTRVDGKDHYKDVFVGEVVLTASKCGKVIPTHYIAPEQRWNMYAKGEEPLAWQPMPEHPYGAE